MLAVKLVLTADDAFYKASELGIFEQLRSGTLLKKKTKNKGRRLTRTVYCIWYLYGTTSVWAKKCSNQQLCRWFILWEEWETGGTGPCNHKERISVVKDTLFIQKPLLLWRTHCSSRVICGEMTSLQGLYTLCAHTSICVENMQTQVNKTLFRIASFH